MYCLLRALVHWGTRSGKTSVLCSCIGLCEGGGRSAASWAQGECDVCACCVCVGLVCCWEVVSALRCSRLAAAMVAILHAWL